MPRARKKVCARRKRPASVGGFLGRRPSKCRHCCGRAPARRRSAALPVDELRSAIILRTRVGPSIGRVGARVNARRPGAPLAAQAPGRQRMRAIYRRGFVRAASALRTVVGSLAITRK